PHPTTQIQNPAARAAGSRLITVARFGWMVLAVLTTGLFIASVPARYGQLTNPTPAVRQALTSLDWSVNLYAAYQVGLEIGLALVFSSVALVVFWRRSHEGVALVVATMLLLAGTAMRPLVVTMNALLVTNPEWTPLIRVLNYLTWLSIVGFFYL